MRHCGSPCVPDTRVNAHPGVAIPNPRFQSAESLKFAFSFANLSTQAHFQPLTHSLKKPLVHSFSHTRTRPPHSRTCLVHRQEAGPATGCRLGLALPLSVSASIPNRLPRGRQAPHRPPGVLERRGENHGEGAGVCWLVVWLLGRVLAPQVHRCSPRFHYRSDLPRQELRPKCTLSRPK